MRTRKGFTLIELLVVIAIIGILSSVVLASLNIARAKARDAKRLADLKQLQVALELYANDNNNSYPNTGNGWQGNCSSFGSFGLTGASGYIPNLAPQYISILPVDPSQVGTKCYLYRSDGSNYTAMAYRTVETYTAANNPKPWSAEPTMPDFTVCSMNTPGC